MPASSDKIKRGLDETRMLMLGAQVLLGAEYRSVFETDFPRLPEISQYLKLISLGLLLVVVGLLLSPVAYDKIVADEHDSPAFEKFITRVAGVALLPFALALGIDLYVVTAKTAGAGAALGVGIVSTVVALFFWYGLEAAARVSKRRWRGGDALHPPQETAAKKPTPLPDRITNVLTEGRVILPGAQALLGFQFISVLTQGFNAIPASSRYMHLGSLGLVGLSTVLLMTPPAYHRIVENGEDTEDFFKVAQRLVLASMIPLALGLCGDLYVVVEKVCGSWFISALSASVTLVFLFGLWFGYTGLRRRQKPGAILAPAESEC
jgi:hypothetical protein